MALKVRSVRGPAFLASALVNGDLTSFDLGTPEQQAEDLAFLEDFRAWCAPGYVVSTEGPDSVNEFEALCIRGRWFRGQTVAYVVHYMNEEET